MHTFAFNAMGTRECHTRAGALATSFRNYSSTAHGYTQSCATGKIRQAVPSKNVNARHVQGRDYFQVELFSIRVGMRGHAQHAHYQSAHLTETRMSASRIAHDHSIPLPASRAPNVIPRTSLAAHESHLLVAMLTSSHMPSRLIFKLPESVSTAIIDTPDRPRHAYD